MLCFFAIIMSPHSVYLTLLKQSLEEFYSNEKKEFYKNGEVFPLLFSTSKDKIWTFWANYNS